MQRYTYGTLARCHFAERLHVFCASDEFTSVTLFFVATDIDHASRYYIFIDVLLFLLIVLITLRLTFHKNMRWMKNYE